MNASLTINDARLLARIINLALRHGCTYSRLVAQRRDDRYETQVEFEGPTDALARLGAQIDKLANDDKETFFQ